MEESSWLMRLTLLLLAAGLVAGVYLYAEVRRRRRQRQRRAPIPVWPPRGPRQEEEIGVDAGGHVADTPQPLEEVVAVRVRKSEPLTDLPTLRREQDDPRPSIQTTADQTATTRGKRPHPQAAQMKLRLTEDRTPAAADGITPDPTILALYLRPAVAPVLVGPAIVRNANAVGMRHGDMQVFHYFASAGAADPEPLFSLANMLEPGHFDLQRIEAFQTPGIVLFLPLPAALDGATAFELFLGTTRRLAAGMRALVYADPDTVLDEVSLARLRLTADAYRARELRV